MLGVERPVVETKMRWSTCWAFSLALDKHVSTASADKSVAARMYVSFFSRKEWCSLNHSIGTVK